MAYFNRTRPVPNINGACYSKFRPSVRSDFREHCGYCLLPELLAAGEDAFELDHFRPRSRFPTFETDFYNLYYACHPCNRIKHDKWPSEELQQRGIGIVDLCADDFETHFRLQPDGRWEGLTPSAVYTIDLLRLNRAHLVQVRLLIQAIILTGTERGKS